ncbi:MAG: histidine phosphatase family protein [Candidatus Paceibacterota bacterium]
MKLYFARHGETESNLLKRVGSFGDRLTDNGRVQARQLAARVAGEAIDLIIASPYERTKETAAIVAGIIGKDVLETALLGEKKWPGEITGKLLNDPEVEKIFELMKEKNNSDPGWHYGDEENFLDIKKRAELFIEYVSGLGEKNILAVSHEYFIKTVIAVMIFGDKLTFDIFRSFFHSTCLANTSLTLCEKEQDAWKLVTLNDLPK